MGVKAGDDDAHHDMMVIVMMKTMTKIVDHVDDGENCPEDDDDDDIFGAFATTKEHHHGHVRNANHLPSNHHRLRQQQELHQHKPSTASTSPLQFSASLVTGSGSCSWKTENGLMQRVTRP